MNDLLQSKKLLENKIALTNGNIERKKKEFDRLQEEANEVQLIIEALIIERWKDQASLDAVNEEISRIPTLALQKTNPQSFKHERFILKRLKRLQNDMDNTGSIGNSNNYQSLEVVQKRGKRLCR